MGLSISRYTELANNELLLRFSSQEVICPNNPFWNQMLAFNIIPPKNSEEQLMFDSSTEALLQKFLANNPQTGNLGSLVQVFITRATELLASPSTDNAMLAWQTFNALFVIRAVTKYLIETVPEYQLSQHLDVQAERDKRNLRANGPIDNAHEADSNSDEALESPTISPEIPDVVPTLQDPPPLQQPSEEARTAPTESQTSPKLNLNESRVEMLIDALVGLIIDVPVTDNTYYLHLECINTILVLMSVYMFASLHGQTRLVETSLIYRTLFQSRYSMHAPLLVKTLLNNFASMHIAPEHMFGYNHAGGSLVLGLASGLWSMLTFSSGSNKPQSIYTQPPVDRQELGERLLREHPVANQSCLLLLTLTNHCMSADNLYRGALLCCQDVSETSSTTPQRDSVVSNAAQMSPPRIEMTAVHRALCATAGCEHSTLLLYLLLHSCKSYKRYVCAVANIELLIVPMLQCLYRAPDSNSHHIYMSLIVLLILTEDDVLIKTVHQIMLKNPMWYTERSISEISLGGMMILIIIRTVQYNILRVRDKYLHTNCLAALANMSSEFRNLHPYVAQRLVSLFETLSKRRTKLLSEMEDRNLNELNIPRHPEDQEDELWEHMSVLEEVLRMLLEILNSCLAGQLQHNLNLVYALLYKRAVFAQCRADPPFHHIVQNIEMVIGYFSSRLQRVQEGSGGDLGVTEVLTVIKRGAEQWSSDRLKKFPELKFRYVEEEKPEEFFTPYVWCLLSSCGAVYWSSEGSARAVKDLASC